MATRLTLLAPLGLACSFVPLERVLVASYFGMKFCPLGAGDAASAVSACSRGQGGCIGLVRGRAWVITARAGVLVLGVRQVVANHLLDGSEN